MPQVEYCVPVGGAWMKITERRMREFEHEDPATYAEMDDRIRMYQENPLSFALPHGRPRQGDGNEGLGFLNDWTNDLLLLTAPSQTGKTYHGALKTGLFCVPCDPNWPCFTEHGVEFVEWTGPKEVIIASWSWDNINVVWQTYRKIMPRSELLNYSPNWGVFGNETGKAKDIALSNSSKRVQLKCGTIFTLLCYTQSLMHFETRQCDCAHLDEQAPEAHFDGITARQLTRGDYTPIWMTLTGYVLPERPDTGAHGWVKRKIVDGTADKGRKVAQYHIAMDDVPDNIVSPAKKRAAYQQHVEEPRRLNDEKRIRAGVAKYYGGWEVGGGLVLSEWNPAIHEIEPFDVDKLHPTYYRMIDHGNSPCAGLLFAVMPWGDAVIFSEYYEFGLTIGGNARKMVEVWCGNTRELVDHYDLDGKTWPIYRELYSKISFVASELDGRSFRQKATESQRTIGSIYQQFGITVSPSSTDHNLIDHVHQWCGLDKARVHINAKLGRKVPDEIKAYGAPRMYAFKGLSYFRAELNGWIVNIKTGKPIDRDDHLMSCMRQFAARNRPYLGDIGARIEQDAPGVRPAVSSVTGY